jgi:hypothetical protein
VYSRKIDDQEYTFGVSGKLVRNVLVMYDRQTESLWSQLLGEAIQGELQGKKLEYLPSFQTTWSDWKTQHPETLALRKGYYGDRDPYQRYYQSGQTGVIGETFSDDRLYIKEFVIGVELSEAAIAFPFSELNDQPLVNYTLGDDHILVLFNHDTGLGIVYDRQIGDKVLTFERLDDQTLRDLETKSVWNEMEGKALDGPLAGQMLERIKSTASFWFGWKDFHPETLIFAQ